MNAKENRPYVYERRQEKNHVCDEPASQVEIVELREGETFERNLNEPEIAFICKGRVVLDLGARRRETIEKRKFILLPPGSCVAVKAVEEAHICICRPTRENMSRELIRPDRHGGNATQETRSFRILTMGKPVIRFLRSLIPCVREGKVCTCFIQTKMSELLLLLKAYYSPEEVMPFFLLLLGPESAFREYLYKNAETAGSVKELAMQANMSKRGFLKRFKRVMGCTPAEFMNSQKADKIRRELLYDQTPIKEISDRYGFSSVQAFTAFCKKNLKETPAKIRKENLFTE